jgi:hypothetical protein
VQLRMILEKANVSRQGNGVLDIFICNSSLRTGYLIIIQEINQIMTDCILPFLLFNLQIGSILKSYASISNFDCSFHQPTLGRNFLLCACI